ncbi:enterobactin receptor protein (plasmid) [Zymomonas mobilis subsp. mobilis str. CP4 = NRRL B-14023]|uniref:TonB-dependent receptor n=1 Tax=Zymomonas mobilis subsp. mobilis (strain ATCC 31821 / ZM4 / CP4) TaxID=264203 RepID=A0A806CDZ4_ZYMMO|nr:TonB-dependent receptor [Zymomonas mobilis subsp. mobilis ZM4 = ATCC 31821]AHB11090.1 outer membrane receptor protein [Zymomonas mobilis subsp. mobilis str. CP4 = NRRL B-14023]AHJ71360.1 enterobactin receptor protein [Zymomonas mobilis subsp. mobilis NRRL B-12526]AHJ73210.1 enterobactin receptor protein [Zymomonas mobilis subsp. mobilis str. CP4 = NRRL B-14023]
MIKFALVSYIALTSAFPSAVCVAESVQAQSSLETTELPTTEANNTPAIQVTARRRFDPFQKTPIAMSVFTKEQTAKVNVHDIQGIFAFIPSANFRTAASSKDRSIFIRGIGTISTSPGVEPSVSTSVDGVVFARAGQASADLLDLDHIEVFRGPQGTLSGKNASAGTVNITTSAPTEDFHGYGEVSYFSGNEYRISGGVSGSLVKDKLIANASFLVGSFDGNVHNDYLNKTVNGYKHHGGRSKFVWTADDNTKVTLGLDYMYSNDNTPNGIFTSTSRTAFPSGITTANPTLKAALQSEGISPFRNNNHISNNTLSHSTDYNGGASLTVERDMGAGYTLTSISAYRRWKNKQNQDYDQLSQPYVGLPQIEDRGRLNFWQASEEIRIASPKGRFFNYVAGFYFLHTDDHENYQRSFEQVSASSPTSANGDATFGTVNNNYAIFGEGNLHFTKKFRVVLGLRLLREDLSYNFNRQSTSSTGVTGIRPNFTSSGSTANNGYVDRIGLQYDITRDIHSYFTYSHGYKGPAYNVFFNMQGSDSSALKPETNNSYEIGLKTQFWDNRITANIAAFIENFSNYQANFLDSIAGGTVTRLVNAGSVSTEGVEGDITVRPFRHFTLGGNFAYTHAVVDHFNCPTGAPLSCNVNGQPLPFAPRWKFTISTEYTKDLDDRFRFAVGSSYNWQSRTQYSLTETPDTIQKAYGVWNLNTSIEDKKNKLRLTLILRNALNTHYASYIGYGSLGGVASWLPRDYGRYGGFTVRKDF